MRAAVLTALAVCAQVLPGEGSAQQDGDPRPDHPGWVRVERTEVHMGTTFRIVVYAPSEASAAPAIRDAYRTIARLDANLSDYRADSEVSRLASSEARPRAVSEGLWRVLEVASEWTERTAGAFDVTVGPLTQLWRWSARRGALPGEERLAEARAAVGTKHLTLDSARRTVRMERPGMALDLGGIAKGFAADRALDVLVGHGLTRALVDAGGDLALGSAPPDRTGWRVELPGGEVVELCQVGVATSGDRFQYLEVDGVRYSHIVDPRTGLGVVDAPTVVVIAGDAVSADVLASALTVMDEPAGKALVDSLSDVHVRVIGSRSWETVGFPPQSSHDSSGAPS